MGWRGVRSVTCDAHAFKCASTQIMAHIQNFVILRLTRDTVDSRASLRASLSSLSSASAELCMPGVLLVWLAKGARLR